MVALSEIETDTTPLVNPPPEEGASMGDGGGSTSVSPKPVFRFRIKLGNTILRPPGVLAGVGGGGGHKESSKDGDVSAKKDDDKDAAGKGGDISNNKDKSESALEGGEKIMEDVDAVSGKSTDEEKGAESPKVDDCAGSLEGPVTRKRRREMKMQLFDERESTEEERERTKKNKNKEKEKKKKKSRSMFSFALTDEEIAADMATLEMLWAKKKA